MEMVFPHVQDCTLPFLYTLRRNPYPPYIGISAELRLQFQTQSSLGQHDLPLQGVRSPCLHTQQVYTYRGGAWRRLVV